MNLKIMQMCFLGKSLCSQIICFVQSQLKFIITHENALSIIFHKVALLLYLLCFSSDTKLIRNIIIKP